MSNRSQFASYKRLRDVVVEGIVFGTVLSVLSVFSAFATEPNKVAGTNTDASLPSSSAAEKVIIDTDIGIDVDDAFAIALALRTPDLDVLGFSTASGDTLARARIIDRMLGESGHSDIPVAVGIPTQPPGPDWPDGIIGLQKRYGENGTYARNSHPAALDFIRKAIQQYPGQVTLIAIGPLSNVGALIDRDPVSFRKLKRVVMMGGWIGTIADEGLQGGSPKPEYNITLDIRSAQKLFHSGVPIFMMPLDSTIQLKLDEVKRKQVFTQSTPMTDSLALLYLLWGNTTPILFDAMAVAFTTDPSLCPVTPLHIEVDEHGVTEVKETGAPNAQVCLHSDPNSFLAYFMDRVTEPREGSQRLAAKQ